MIVLKFEKWLTLWRYNGIPMYVGSRLITQKSMVWWWPINWIAIAMITPGVVFRMIKRAARKESP